MKSRQLPQETLTCLKSLLMLHSSPYLVLPSAHCVAAVAESLPPDSGTKTVQVSFLELSTGWMWVAGQALGGFNTNTKLASDLDQTF